VGRYPHNGRPAEPQRHKGKGPVNWAVEQHNLKLPKLSHDSQATQPQPPDRFGEFEPDLDKPNGCPWKRKHGYAKANDPAAAEAFAKKSWKALYGEKTPFPVPPAAVTEQPPRSQVEGAINGTTAQPLPDEALPSDALSDSTPSDALSDSLSEPIPNDALASRPTKLARPSPPAAAPALWVRGIAIACDYKSTTLLSRAYYRLLRACLDADERYVAPDGAVYYIWAARSEDDPDAYDVAAVPCAVAAVEA